MGYYDGIGMTEEASTYQVARALRAPAILVIGARGMASSVLAVLEGFLCHKADSNIRGVIFNQLSGRLYERLKDQVCSLGVEPLGYLPSDRRVEIGSRHLGLVTADEIADLKEKMNILSQRMEETVDIGGILRLAEEAEPLDAEMPESIASAARRMRKYFSAEAAEIRPPGDASKNHHIIRLNLRVIRPRIAVAQDEAFCFTYRANLDLLRQLGAELISFSPLSDAGLPQDIDGLIISGGYPELHAAELEKNESMRMAVKSAIQGGMPVIAECGGFMYLHQELEGISEQSCMEDGCEEKDDCLKRSKALPEACEGIITRPPKVGKEDRRLQERGTSGFCYKMYKMAGAVDGVCSKKDRLVRFGYIEITAEKDGMLADAGERLRAHEFHYWDSTENGADFLAEKADRSKSWRCAVSTETMYAGFPHLFFCSSPSASERFVKKCAEYRKRRRI